VNDQNQARNELIELLHEIVDALASRKSVQLTDEEDEDVRRYEARAARIQQLSDKTCDPQLR
jgi:hypothetical protein